MKPASGTLIALLNGNNAFLMADLLTLSLFDGTTIRLTDGDTNLAVGANTFLCSSDQDAGTPTFTRGNTRCVVGLEVDTLEVTLNAGGSVKLSGISLPHAAMNGVFDGARVKLERVFMPSWGDTSPGTVVLFEGRVAGVDPSSTQVRITVKADLEILNVAMPRNVCMPSCSHVLYGPGCGVAKATYTVMGTVGASATTTSVPSNRTEATDYFRLGVMVMTSGPAAGSRRAVKAYANAGGTFTPVVPFPSAPGAGNTFSVTPGCDHTTGPQGCAKFSNLNRFRGYPYVPRPETAR